jgi:hypothetical protein
MAMRTPSAAVEKLGIDYTPWGYNVDRSRSNSQATQGNLFIQPIDYFLAAWFAMALTVPAV